MDAAGLLTLLAGPLGKAAGLLRGEGTALRFSDKALTELRAAGYTDEVIAGLEGQLGQAVQQSGELNAVLRTATPEQLEAKLLRLRAGAGGN